jgi:uncharacterized protein YecT (DUF1311 family)
MLGENNGGFMKLRKYSPIILFTLLFVGCTHINTATLIQPKIEITVVTKVITQRITQVVLIFQTPTPSNTPPWGSSATFTNTRTPSCYDTAMSTIQINACAWSITEKTKEELDKLVDKVAKEYSGYPERREKFIQSELEWESHAEDECYLWWGSLDESGFYEHGSMAPMLVATCLDGKYKKRITELQQFYNDIL